MKCSVHDCGRSSRTKGLCSMHYKRLRSNGDPLITQIPRHKAKALFYEILKTGQDVKECIYWPHAKAGRERRPWVKIDGKQGYVARFLCEKVHGNQPSNNMQAAHICGDCKCVNPWHLRWATPVENAADKIRHGTHGAGILHPRCRLTNEDVYTIRKLAGYLKMTEIAKIYSMTPQGIEGIIKRKSWRHI